MTAAWIAIGALVADNLSTWVGLRRGLVETNPLLGAHPTLLRLALVAALEAAAILLAIWLLPAPWAGYVCVWEIAVHATGTASNLRALLRP